MPQRVSQLSRKSIERVVPAGLDLEKRLSGTANMRDELLITLLASEAIVDSRGYDILSAEEVEEMKKVCLRLHARLLDYHSPHVHLILHIGTYRPVIPPRGYE